MGIDLGEIGYSNSNGRIYESISSPYLSSSSSSFPSVTLFQKIFLTEGIHSISEASRSINGRDVQTSQLVRTRITTRIHYPEPETFNR
ncbi:hypothetical protein YC2023_060252 [Brassica napus]